MKNYKTVRFSFYDDRQYSKEEIKKNVKYEKTANGYEITARVADSSRFNRNKWFFELADLLAKKDTPESVQNDIDHDLAITGGKFLGIKNTQTIKVWGVVSKNGNFEIWVKIRTADPLMVKNIDNFTQPSVELQIDIDQMIVNENGEYYPPGSIDWVATGWLRGVPAGNGNTGITEIKEFDNNPENSNNIETMNKEQVKEFLATDEGAEMKQELQSEFLKDQALTAEQEKQFEEKVEKVAKKVFDKVVEEYKDVTKGTSEYIGEDGKTYSREWISVWQSVTKEIESGEAVSSDTAQFFAKKGFKLEKIEGEGGEPSSEEKQIDNALDSAKKNAKVAKEFSKQQKVANGEESSKVEEIKLTNPLG